MTAAALEVRGLAKSFGLATLSGRVNYRRPRGSGGCFWGRMAPGRPHYSNSLRAKCSPDGGSVRLFGRDIGRLRAHQRARMGLARTFQIMTLFRGDSLLHNVALALLVLVCPETLDMVRPMSHFESELRDRDRRDPDLVGSRPLGGELSSQSSSMVSRGGSRSPFGLAQ